MRQLGELLHELVPAVKTVHRVLGAPGHYDLEIEEEGAPGTARIDELSGGTRQMLLLAALYVQPVPPRILLLEEPDAALHVGALPALRDLLRSLAARSTVIATTHSAAFVGLLDPDREVVALQRSEGGVVAQPLARALADGAWLRAFGSTEQAFVRAGSERLP